MSIIPFPVTRSVLLLLSLAASSVVAQTPEQKTIPATPIPAKLLVDRSAPAGWNRYQMGEGPRFSAIFPVAPQESADKNPVSGGTTYIYLATNENGVFVAARFSGIVGGTAGTERQERFFKEFVTGFAQGMKESLATRNINAELQFTDSKKITTASGQSGFQQDMMLGPFKGRAQVAFVDTSGFAIVALWSATTPASVSEAFFNSFRLTP